MGENQRDCPPSVLASLRLSRRWLLLLGIPSPKPFPRLVAFAFLKELVFRVQLRRKIITLFLPHPLPPQMSLLITAVGLMQEAKLQVLPLSEGRKIPGRVLPGAVQGMDPPRPLELPCSVQGAHEPSREPSPGSLPCVWIIINLSRLFPAQAQIIL